MLFDKVWMIKWNFNNIYISIKFNYFYKIIQTNIGFFYISRYAGRPVSASPATGNKKTHMRELKQFLDKTLS